MRTIIKSHRYGSTLFAYLTAAVATGVTYVLFMRSFEWVIAHRLDAHRIGLWCVLMAPGATCALLGMAAFLSGTIQAPLTAFVIIFEMTGNHELLVPVMLASFVSLMTARLLKADHLYSRLADNYKPLIER